MKIVCSRNYGEPKLIKPKVCNNQNLIGSVIWNLKCKCKVWKVENTIYVLHRDWFSNCIDSDNAVKMGIIKPIKNKFVYNDTFSVVVLRNEALLSFEAPDLSKFILDNRFLLIKELAELLGVEWYDIYELCRWEDFFERILKLLMPNT